MKARFKLSRFFIPIMVLFLPLTACGLSVVRRSGNIKVEARPVSRFDSVTFSGSGEMLITQGDGGYLTSLGNQ